MTQLMNLIMFLIAMKFQFIQTQLMNKDDYFNHKEYALPEFLVHESLFTTEKQDLLKNPPWITKEATKIITAAKSGEKLKTTTKSTTSVTVTFETKLKWVQPPPTTEKAIRSNKNNETNVLIPFWSRFSYVPFIKSTTEATTGSSTRSTISYTIRLTPKLTSKATTRPTPKPTTDSTTRSTVTTSTRFFLTTTTPKRTTSLLTKSLVPIAPNRTTTITWFVYLSPKTKKTNNITSKAINIAAFATSNGTATGIVTGTFTKTMSQTPVTNTPTKSLYFEAKLNKIRPENPSIGTFAIPTVFQDLTMKRNGLPEDAPEHKYIDEINQTPTKPTGPKIDSIDKREKLRNILREKETIEYQELTTEPFSKFLELLMQQLAAMDSTNTAKFLRTFERQMGLLMKLGRFDALGPVTNAYILDAFRGFQFPVDHKQRLLSMAHKILANRNDTLGPKLNSLLDYMDMLYAVKSEVHMERVLNETIAYPNISKTAEEITEGFIEDVLLNPLKRISGTTQGNKLIATIADIINDKNSNFNARRVFSQKYYQYPKRFKKVKGVHNIPKIKRKRPKLVFTNKQSKRLFSGEYDRKTTVDRNRDGNIKNFLINSDPVEEEMKSTIKNNIRTKVYVLNLANRGHEIREDKRKLTAESKNSNSDEKIFRAHFNNIRKNNIVNNPFRTLLYKKNKNRFEKSYTDKETYEPYFERTTPNTKTSMQSVTLTTRGYKKKENLTFGSQPPKHESNMYHKQKVKYNEESNKEKIKNLARQSVKSKPNSYHETESMDNDITSDIEVTTTTKRHAYKPNKVKKGKRTQNSPKLPKNIDKIKSEKTRDTETTQSELKEANVSLKHFYFKPVIMQNKSGDDNFISIEFDGEPNVIDFSMKVKLKKPITQPNTQKESDLQNTDISETTTSPSTNALRVLNPYKMDTYFKNNGTKHENRSANDKESSTDDSDSSSDDSGNSDVSSEKGKDSQPHVFGKLRKIENREHKKQKLRSKKHGESKKHHHGRKHEKHKGHHRHGKHGKKRRHKFFHAYLKKTSHDRKKRIKHKLKQLKDKRIVGKNFEIAFDTSSDDSEGKNLIDVTIVKRAKGGKRATISLVNKGEKFRSSDSSISREEEKIKHATTKKSKKSSVSANHIKHKNKQRTDTTNTALEVKTTGESFHQKHVLRNIDHNTGDNNQEDDHPELTTVHHDNSHQVMANESTLSTEENVETTLLPKDTTKNEITSPKLNAIRKLLKKGNKNRKRKKLSPMLIQINKPNKNGNNRAKPFRKVKNKVPTAQRRFFPIQVFNNSEYSDEEDELKRNLYDAFRHKDEIYYRRNMRHELPLKHELREESDVTDEEILLKENIYKAIKENNRRSNRNRK